MWLGRLLFSFLMFSVMCLHKHYIIYFASLITFGTFVSVRALTNDTHLYTEMLLNKTIMTWWKQKTGKIKVYVAVEMNFSSMILDSLKPQRESLKFQFKLRSISIQNQFIIICKFMSPVINVILVKIHFTLRKNIKFKGQNFCAADVLIWYKSKILIV